VIRTSPREPLQVRLRASRVNSGPDPEASAEAAAVEEVFHAVNVKTALKLAHVRGVALLAVAEAKLPLGEYSPLEIKTSVVGYGRAEKHQVQLMVRSLLALEEPIESEDAADALAVAICHATRVAVTERLGA
jgi:crossover junction endodeoxyribonuclease RuvC